MFGAIGVTPPELAVYEIGDGLLSPPLFVTLIECVAALAAVYVKVAVGVPLLMFTAAGVKVPPAPLSLGVTVTVPVMLPFAPTVKFVEATPTVPLDGPDRVTAVAAPDVAVYVIGDGFDRPPSFVTLIERAPVVLGV